MKPFHFALAIGLATAQFGAVAQAADITGAGATFPFPVYSKWAEAYRKDTGTGLNYQSIGLRRRHQADPGQDRRFRRHRRPAEGPRP